MTQYLAHRGAVTTAELRPLLYYRHDREAIRHLLRVAAGLDSLILGEPQILGQVAAAHAAAHAAGVAGAVLSHLFHQALHCGKQVRTETAIAGCTTSLSNTAVRLAAQRLGDLSSCSALVVGAGEMASHAAMALRQSGTGSILCVNRNLARAEATGAARWRQRIGLDTVERHFAHGRPGGKRHQRSARGDRSGSGPRRDDAPCGPAAAARRYCAAARRGYGSRRRSPT